MAKYYFIALFLSILYFSGANAQYIPFDNLTPREESARKKLPAGYIYDIEQDSLGYIWLASQIGVIRYDGYQFEVFSSQDGLPDNNVIDILVDSKNRVWLAMESGGLAYFYADNPGKINIQEGIISNYGQELLEDHAGNIWYFSFEGIYIIRKDSIENLSQEKDNIYGKIFATHAAQDGKVWFSTNNQLYFYLDSLCVYEHPLFFDVGVNDIEEGRENTLWFATSNKGLIHIKNNTIEVFSEENMLPGNQISAIKYLGADTLIIATVNPSRVFKIVEETIVTEWPISGNIEFKDFFLDSRKRIWLSTENGGLFGFTENTLAHYTSENNLVDDMIFKILEDQNGNIWFATQKGLSKYGKVIFQVFKEDADDDNSVLSIAEKDGDVFIGHYNGLSILENIQSSNSQVIPENLPEVFTILPSDEKLWLGSYNGIVSLQSGKSKYFHYTKALDLEIDQEWTTDIIEHKNALYCATSRGLVVFEDETFRLFDVDHGLSDNNIWSLAVDTNGYIWCATWNGLSIFDGQGFHNYFIEQGLPDNYCNDICFDELGQAWLATDNGISRIVLKEGWNIECSNISSDDGLKSNVIFLIIADKRNYIWVGHNAGLDRIDPGTMEINHYGMLEGFTPVETSLGAATLTKNNDIWFGTAYGAVKYIPENDYVYPDPPKVYVKEVKLYEDTSSLAKYRSVSEELGNKIKYVLPYRFNNLIFEYVGLHYTIVEKNQYKYLLEGYDSRWSETTNDISTLYRKIDPGKYTFKVLAANCDGIWTKEPAEVLIEIRPPFWQTWWMYSLEGLTFILLLYLYINFRERKLKHDRDVLAQKVKLRTIEIEKQKDKILLQKKEITDSIEYAEKIQTAVLPDLDEIEKYVNEYFILFKPRDIVSGDFYWFNKKEDCLIIVAADCTGHGVPGAFMSMLGVSILNELATSAEELTSDEYLNQLREHLIKTLKQTGSELEAKDGMDLSLIILNLKKQQLQFSGAYNPLVLIRNNECIIYKGDKMPVGYHLGSMHPFTCQHIDIQKDDCLYMFSDGFADQFGGPDGKKFKSSKFRELLTQIHSLPMNVQKDRLNETIEDWMGINEQIDDILVIGIRI